MIVNIPTTKDRLFKQYLTILNSVLTKNQKLTILEIEVMSKFLFIKDLYNRLGSELSNKICFHKETKKRIIISIKEESNIQISINSLNNIILSLRKKGFLKERRVEHIPVFTKEGNIELVFNLNLV